MQRFHIHFSKIMIIFDYIIMVILMICSYVNYEMVAVVVAWTAQLAISTGFYYWKAKNENRIKIPAEILKSLDKEIDSELDINQIITTILTKD